MAVRAEVPVYRHVTSGVVFADVVVSPQALMLVEPTTTRGLDALSRYEALVQRLQGELRHERDRLRLLLEVNNLLVSRLRASGISADTCRFDFARCSFEPDFRKCVVVPIHSGMTGDGMHRLISCLRQAL